MPHVGSLGAPCPPHCSACLGRGSPRWGCPHGHPSLSWEQLCPHGWGGPASTGHVTGGDRAGCYLYPAPVRAECRGTGEPMPWGQGGPQGPPPVPQHHPAAPVVGLQWGHEACYGLHCVSQPLQMAPAHRGHRAVPDGDIKLSPCPSQAWTDPCATLGGVTELCLCLTAA